MATIDVGTRGSRREANRELALVPFIDFLLCLVAFLLVTAVWTTMSRLPADATVPGKQDCCTEPKPKTLHVGVEDGRFVLTWREGTTVLSKSEVARQAVATEAGDVRYPELARMLEAEWRVNGAHRTASDPKRDSAVLHTPNSLAYADLVGVMDALRQVQRVVPGGSAGGESAFSVSFAVD